MSILSLVLPVLNKPDSTEDPKIITAFTTIQNLINGNLDSSNVKAGSLTGQNLGAETVRMLSSAAYSGFLARVLGAEVELSSSRTCFVTVVGSVPVSTGAVLKLSVNGKIADEVTLPPQSTGTTLLHVAGFVPAGQKFKPESEFGISAVSSSHIVL